MLFMASDTEIGRRIRVAREEQRLTQQTLGRLWGGKSHAAISDIERGATKLSAAGLAELARILGKSTSYFYGESSATYSRGGRTQEGSGEPGQRAAREFIQYLKQRPKKEDS